MNPPDPVRRNVYLLLTAFWLLALGVAAAGYEYYLNQKAAIENEERTKLSAIAELKIRQISSWRDERLADARIVAASPLSQPVRQFLVEGQNTAVVRQQVESWLEAIRSATGYSNAILVNPERRIWVAAGGSASAAEQYFTLGKEAIARGRAELTDLHMDRGLAGPHLGLNVPLRLAAGQAPVGALLLGIDPKKFLYPLISLWPTASPSAETLLVRREGNEVVFLNELRHRSGTSLKLRFPLSNESLPAARGAMGFEGIMTGTDYRGAPVLAAVRRIPDFPWILVAKVDLAEVRAPIARQMFWLGLIGFSVILTIGTGVSLILRDLRAKFDLERYRAEIEHRALRGHYDYLSRFANDIILLTNEAAVVVEANDRAVSTYGYTREELIGMPLRRLRAPGTLDSFEQEWRKTVEHDSLIFETNHLRKDGSSFPVEVSARRVTVDKTVFRQSIIRDISERKAGEKERAALQEKLEQAQRLESIGRLAGGVAHDFNNLLTVINGYSSMVMDALPADDPLHDSVCEVFKAGERAATLTRQLLAFSRKQVIAPKLLNLNTIVLDLAKMLGRMVGEDIAIVTVLEPSLDPVFVDPGQMEQVLMNLATNARDAMPRGGNLLIETSNVHIGDEYASLHVDAAPGDYILLAVTDTGEGMAQETLQRAFEPFFTTKPRGHGTGLGLATVYGAIKQSNGWIWVYSEAGKGTTFKIYLPRASDGASDGASGGVDHAAAHSDGHDFCGDETVLIVEDQLEVRKLAAEALQKYGYHVMEAANGEEALAACDSASGEIHLLVTDVVMPGITGPELVRRAALLKPGMKVLYMSGYTENLIAHQGVLDAGVAYLQKPFTSAGLAEKVREVLDLS
jgi:two-component system cell cycle sensor histidine kinase/response regulator CckA